MVNDGKCMYTYVVCNFSTWVVLGNDPAEFSRTGKRSLPCATSGGDTEVCFRTGLAHCREF